MCGFLGPVRRGLRGRWHASAIALAVLAAGCAPARPTGYWEGKGTAKEVPMKDAFRTLTRSASYEFWFTVNGRGEGAGEIELVYDSDLRVENLPQVTIPLPFAKSASFAPSVGGRVTDLDPRRKFALVALLGVGELTLEVATPEAARTPIEFTIRGDPGVSAGFNGSVVKGNGEASVIKIPMKAFSPFNGAGAVVKRPDGPFAASFDKTGRN